MDRQKWIKAFTKAGIASESAETYADIFVTEKLTWDNLLDRPLLKELGVGVLGDILTIMGLSKGVAVPQASQSLIKAPVARPPQLHSEMTPQQFRKFVIDWEVFVEMTNLPKAQFHNQLYSCASESVQNAIINTHGDFFDKNSDDLLDIIKNIVTQKSNPLVHRMTFAGLSQGQTESIQNYRIRLKSLAQDCDFSCPKCKHDLSEIYIKDQMIRGLDNETLQTDILAKAESLTSLDTVVKHAEAFEAALRDQAKLSDVSDVAALGCPVMPERSELRLRRLLAMVLHLSLNQLLLALAHVSIVWHVLDVVVANMVHLTEHPSVLPGEKLVLHVVVQIILLVYVVRPTLNSLRPVYDLWTLCLWMILTLHKWTLWSRMWHLISIVATIQQLLWQTMWKR